MSTRLYVSNLPVSTTEQMLTIRFGKIGSVVSVQLEPLVRASRRVSVYLALGTVRKKPS